MKKLTMAGLLVKSVCGAPPARRAEGINGGCAGVFEQMIQPC